MITDELNRFSNNQAITASAASTDVIDLGPLGSAGSPTANTRRDIGQGRPLTFFVHARTAFTAGGAATLQVQLQTSDDNSTWVNLTDSGALALASLGAGARIAAQAVPRGVRRYLRVNYTVATGPMTAGAVDAGLVLDYQDPSNNFGSGFKLDT